MASTPTPAPPFLPSCAFGFLLPPFLTSETVGSLRCYRAGVPGGAAGGPRVAIVAGRGVSSSGCPNAPGVRGERPATAAGPGVRCAIGKGRRRAPLPRPVVLNACWDRRLCAFCMGSTALALHHTQIGGPEAVNKPHLQEENNRCHRESCVVQGGTSSPFPLLPRTWQHRLLLLEDS